MNKISMSVSVLLLLVVLSISLFLFFKNKNLSENSIKTYTEEQKKLDSAHNTGDYTTAISGYEKLQNQVPNKAGESKIKAKLAYDLYQRNQDGDREESLKIYKKIVNDFTLPAFTRAIIIDDIADLVNINQTQESELFFQKNLNEEPFITLLKKAGGPDNFSSEKFAIELWKYSDEIYPNALAELNIALKITGPIFDGTLPASTDKIALAKELTKYIEEGTKRKIEIPYEDVRINQINLYRALAMGAVGILDGSIKLPEREAAFKLALEEGKKHLTGGYARQITYRTRYHYAYFLLNNFGDSRTADIKNILTDFKDLETTPTAYTTMFFNWIAKAPENSPIKKMTLRLAKISPEFKKYLLDIGWTL